jgi:hypothetical protein
MVSKLGSGVPTAAEIPIPTFLSPSEIHQVAESVHQRSLARENRRMPALQGMTHRGKPGLARLRVGRAGVDENGSRALGELG